MAAELVEKGLEQLFFAACTFASLLKILPKVFPVEKSPKRFAFCEIPREDSVLLAGRLHLVFRPARVCDFARVFFRTASSAIIAESVPTVHIRALSSVG